jgi:YesN/AraC family two-component response regulator
MDNFDSEVFYMFYLQAKNKAAPFRQGHPVYETLKKCMQESYDEFAAKDVCYKLPIRANIYLMMTALLRYYCGSKNESERIAYHNVLRLRPVINYIAEHFEEKIYIEKLSDIIMVSPDYFTKMFKDSIGKTPVEYINGIRVNRSMKMLLSSDDSVSAIAEKIGFCNANYFNKIFKQYMGISPLAYRKNNK